MFKRVLVANRGEIAVRIISACQALGIETVLAASAADRESLAAQRANRVVCIGAAPASRSYLDVGLIVQAALSTECEAVHPGYGFLSEKYELAAACEENHMTFVGPRSTSIREMGDKLGGRQAAQEAGVPVVPGSLLVERVDDAQSAAAKLGYPVMMKAAAGGGGRGVFVANSAADIERSFDTAAAEARAAFGNGALFLERYIANSRHIEVQVLGDNYGNAIHLGERDCSLQRRYQKVVEEGPAVVLPEALRSELWEAALRLIRHVGYRNAGTIEFLFDDDRKEFFFMEMNTRIQVEHPVTELITAVDIVQEQLKIAAGERLSIQQSDVKIRGHAIECRLNAESPLHGFRPSPGRITSWRAPSGFGIRLDTHCSAGYVVPPFYDSMIGKLLVWAESRDEAIVRMLGALEDFEIGGIETNLELHKFIMNHADYKNERVNTRWLESVLLPGFQGSLARTAG